MPTSDSFQFEDFLRMLAQFYVESGRYDMPWRQPTADGKFEPYLILVSELMLQQTQVVRVTPKYLAFVSMFPDVRALAAAELGDVLRLWSGLGYNRRAKFLHQAAAAVVDGFDGEFPRTAAELQSLPGVGPGTAGAIMAYAYDRPVIYLETNIRTVLIHHFYASETDVSDPVLRETLSKIVKYPTFHDYFTPREFYWAMMDYGSFLKRSVGNLNRSSRSYSRQTAFHGSRRQVRGLVIRLLTERKYAFPELELAVSDERLQSVLQDLIVEELIIENQGSYSLS